MNHFFSIAKQQALPLFCALTIALSFAATLLPLPGEAVPVVMVCIPGIVALCLTAMVDGWAGVRTLVSKPGQWRARPLWVVVAVGFGLVLRLTMSVLAVLLGLLPRVHLRLWTPAQIALFAVMLFVFAIPEELGWRGYALPKLLKTCSPLVAGLIIGVLWGSLHLALTLPGMINAGAPPLPTLLGLIGLSVLATWLYIRTNGNLLLTSLFHAAQSFFVIVNDGIAVGQQTWLIAGVYLAAAVLIAIAAGPSFAQRPVGPIERRATRSIANRSM
jgi:membrane protease YdiL (CAAX protease family)